LLMMHGQTSIILRFINKLLVLHLVSFILYLIVDDARSNKYYICKIFI
jgi:hypothetical protein